MNSTTDKIKGYANEAAGKAKQAAGAVLDDPKMKNAGRLQEAKGEAQKASGKVKDAMKDGIDRI